MRIGEVAEAAQTPVSTVRFYERKGLVAAPDRSGNGYRRYADDTVDRIIFIRRAQGAGISLQDIGDILAIRDSGQPPCNHVRSLLTERMADVQRQLVELTSMKESLEGLISRAETLDDQAGQNEATAGTICPILQ